MRTVEARGESYSQLSSPFEPHRLLNSVWRDVMPEFCNAFSGITHERKLTHEELVRAIRFMIAAEYEAVQLYMQLAESTDDVIAKDVLQDIADEERVHAGEFLRLLKHVAPDEERFYQEGAGEVEEIVERLKG
jgi:rubrerythrin